VRTNRTTVTQRIKYGVSVATLYKNPLTWFVCVI